MIDHDILIQDYIDFMRTRDFCKDTVAVAIIYLEKMISPTCQTLKDLTKLINKGNSKYASYWAYWMLIDHGEKLASDLRAAFISRITDPTLAKMVNKQCGWVTKAESEILLNIRYKGDWK